MWRWFFSRVLTGGNWGGAQLTGPRARSALEAEQCSMHGCSTDSDKKRIVPLFDRRLWRHPLMRKLGLGKTPNLAGRWQGYLTSSFDNHAKRYDLCVQIVQSWTQISVSLTTATSASWSCVGVIQVSDPDGVASIYQCENQPLADATRTMHIHFGTAMLRVSDGHKLTGDYYAGRDRGTFARISCCRLPPTIKQSLGCVAPSPNRLFVLQ